MVPVLDLNHFSSCGVDMNNWTDAATKTLMLSFSIMFVIWQLVSSNRLTLFDLYGVGIFLIQTTTFFILCNKISFFLFNSVLCELFKSLENLKLVYDSEMATVYDNFLFFDEFHMFAEKKTFSLAMSWDFKSVFYLFLRAELN